MQREVVQAWQQVVEMISGIPSICVEEDHGLAAVKLQLLHAECTLVVGPVTAAAAPAITSRCCEMLVRNMQVPRKIAQACCSVMGRDLNISAGFVGLLTTFLNMASCSELLYQPNARPTELAAAIEQQLQQAGLYQHLQQFFADISAQLAAAEATPALLAAMDAPGQPQDSLTNVLLTTMRAVKLYEVLISLSPADSTGGSSATPASWDASIDAAAMSLALITVQQLSAWVEPLSSSSPEPYDVLTGIMHNAWIAVAACAQRVALACESPAGPYHTTSELPHMSPLLLSQHFLAAVCMSFMYGTQCSLLGAEAVAAGHMGGTGTSSSNSSGQQGSPWARACSRAQQLPPRQQELLQDLKVSGKLLLWAAEANSDDTNPIFMLRLMEAYTQIQKAVKRADTADLGRVRESALQAARLHMLVPAVMLPWANAAPRDSRSLAVRCTVAGTVSGTALDYLVAAPKDSDPAFYAMALLAKTAYLPDITLMFTQLLDAARKQSSNASIPSADTTGELLNAALMPAVTIFWSLAQASRDEPVGDQFMWYPQPSTCSKGSQATGTACGTGITSSEPTGAGSRNQAQHPWQPYAAQLLAAFESHVRMIKVPSGAQAHFPWLQDLVCITLPARLCAVGECPQQNALAATAVTAGFGSTEQQHLFGFLSSLLKRSSMLGPTQQPSAEECRMTVASVAARLAQLYAGHATASSDEGPYAAAAASRCMSELLPWLVLFGRCCLQWAVQLQQQLHGTTGTPDAAVQQAPMAPNTFMGVLHISSSNPVPFVIPDNAPAAAQPVISVFLAALQTPLLDAGIAAHVSAAGVNAESLRNKIHAVEAAAAAMQDGPAVQDEAIEAVQDLGEALTALPCTTACNNPLCTNISGASEKQLVCGSNSSTRCSACRTVRYCGRQCQAKHWKQHKPVCKALQGQLAAAAATIPAAAAASEQESPVAQ